MCIGLIDIIQLSTVIRPRHILSSGEKSWTEVGVVVVEDDILRVVVVVCILLLLPTNKLKLRTVLTEVGVNEAGVDELNKAEELNEADGDRLSWVI